MQTDPLSNISSAINTPIPQSTVRSDQPNASLIKTDNKKEEAISDTLETSDREGDGKLPYQPRAQSESSETGDQTDRVDDSFDAVG